MEGKNNDPKTNEKKATVRDIAAQAGVSVATVSYVLNDKKDTKISEQTRKKVLQIANLLNYSIPDRYKNDTPEKVQTYSIGIIYSLRPETPSRNEEIMHLVNLLAERLNRMNYHCLIFPVDTVTEDYEPVPGLSGIIAIDLEESSFKKLSNSYYIPILCLDMMINDFLFYQIHTDMESLVKQGEALLGGDFLLVTEPFSNKGYQNYIASVLPDDRFLVVTGDVAGLKAKLKGKKVLAYGSHLGLRLSSLIPGKDLCVITGFHEDPGLCAQKTLQNDLEKKANLAFSIMLNALEKKFDVKHEYKVC